MTDNEIDRAIEENRSLWDTLVDGHVKAPLYDVAGFLAGKDRLGNTETAEVGDVAGKRLLHLLCRFGLDTLCWARRGATVTGVDIAPKAIVVARDLARQSGLAATFIESDVRTCQPLLTPPYDIIFLSWGALCWLPDMNALARLASDVLAPGGIFYVLDGHPMALAADEDWSLADGLVRLKWDYQTGNCPDVDIWDNNYADPAAPSPGMRAHEWGHGLGRIVTALTAAGLCIEFLHEHEEAGWRMMRGMEPTPNGLWRLPDGVSSLPFSFSLRAGPERHRPHARHRAFHPASGHVPPPRGKRRRGIGDRRHARRDVALDPDDQAERMALLSRPMSRKARHTGQPTRQ